MPLCIDLFCGLGGWAEGFLSEGYEVIGFDIERHRYPRIARESGSVKRPGMNWSKSDKPGYKAEAFNSTAFAFTDEIEEYPGQLVLQDVATLHGSQFRNADVIVASPPCQAYSYRAMPWKRAKALPPPDNTLFETCFRIQNEAMAYAGRYIPMVVENVRGAEKWVGPARWHYGSYYLWGDVPALMPLTFKAVKVPSFRFDGSGRSFQTASVRRTDPGKGARSTSRDCGDERKNGGDWFGSGANCSLPRKASRKSPARKAASAQIAKIPFPLAQHIARVYKPNFSPNLPVK